MSYHLLFNWPFFSKTGIGVFKACLLDCVPYQVFLEITSCVVLNTEKPVLSYYFHHHHYKVHELYRINPTLHLFSLNMYHSQCSSNCLHRRIMLEKTKYFYPCLIVFNWFWSQYDLFLIAAALLVLISHSQFTHLIFSLSLPTLQYIFLCNLVPVSVCCMHFLAFPFHITFQCNSSQLLSCP